MARHYILELCPANSYNPSREKPATATPESIRIPGYRRCFAATPDSCSRTSLVKPPAPSQGPITEPSRRSAQIFDRYILPVSPFVVAFVVSTTCYDTNESRLPCREHRLSYTPGSRLVTTQLSTQATLPICGVSNTRMTFRTPCVLFRAPVTTPAAAELPALVIASILRITSLSRVTGRDVGRMSSSPEPA